RKHLERLLFLWRTKGRKSGALGNCCLFSCFYCHWSRLLRSCGVSVLDSREESIRIYTNIVWDIGEMKVPSPVEDDQIPLNGLDKQAGSRVRESFQPNPLWGNSQVRLFSRQ